MKKKVVGYLALILAITAVVLLLIALRGAQTARYLSILSAKI